MPGTLGSSRQPRGKSGNLENRKAGRGEAKELGDRGLDGVGSSESGFPAFQIYSFWSRTFSRRAPAAISLRPFSNAMAALRSAMALHERSPPPDVGPQLPAAETLEEFGEDRENAIDFF